MSASGFTLDDREWQSAIRLYSTATYKTLADAQNRQHKNWAIQALKIMKKAETAMIEHLKTLPWWPKYIAGIMRNQAGGSAGSKVFQAQWADAEKRKRDKAQKGQKAFKLDIEERSYAKYARDLSTKILGRRKVAVTFMKAFLAQMANAFDSVAREVRTPAIKAFSGFKVSVKAASPRDLSVSVVAEYDYVKRGDKTARGAEGKGMEALEKAKPLAIADMIQYAEKKQAEHARRYSG
jgi:hypothetical protein